MPSINIKARYYGPFFYSDPVSDAVYKNYKHPDYTLYYLNSFPEHTWISAYCYNILTKRREIVENICTDYPYVDNFNLSGKVYDAKIHTRQDGLSSGLYPDLEGKSLHRRYLHITKPADYGNYGQFIIISGDFVGEMAPNDKFYIVDDLQNNGKVTSLTDDEGYIVFTAVSEDYDKFLCKAVELQQLKESSDLSTVYLRENQYSNISGGLGLFGAINEEKMQWTGEFSYWVDKD